MPTQNATSRKGPLIALVAIVVVALVGVGLWTIKNGTPQIATVTFDSEPSGAMVKRNDSTLCTTPCTRELDPGALTFVVEKSGFVSATRSVELKAGVEEKLPKIVLEPQKAGGPVVVVVNPPPEVSTSLVKIDSDPQGAELRVNGEVVGTTPHELSLPYKSAVDVKLELAGYAVQIDHFTVAEAAEDPHKYALKALPKSNNVKPPIVKNNNPPPEVKPPVVAGGKGTVRFVVKPWAEVECPGIGIKDTTPFADKQVAVGSYTCTFTNPEFPAPQTKLVKVEPNQTTKVQVNFTQ